MDHSKNSDLQNLRHIGSVARNIQSLCPTPSSKQPSLDFRSHPTLSSQLIPGPKSILPVLESIGLPSVLVEEVSNAYLKVSNELRAVCESSLRSAIEMASSKGPVETDAIQGMIRTWSDTLSRQTTAWAEAALSRAQQLVTTQSLKTALTLKDVKKTSFNHEYTPLLEKYFEYNAYPSAPDRAVLARKSMMTSRQIEVWFQNHRNRAKKDGKILRKLTSDSLPVNLSLESLESQMPFFTIPEGERVVNEFDPTELESSDEELSFPLCATPKNSSIQDEITMHAPSHSFPTTYPPSCNYDPFPTKTGNHTFPPPVWMRTASAAFPPRATATVNDLITDFTMKLLIRDGPSKKQRQESSLAVPSTRRPWFAATHTTPPPAPHPAFIRSAPAQVPISLPKVPAVIAPRSRLYSFRSPSPPSQPSMLMSISNGSTTRRKVARLPKRTPVHASVAHRSASPTNWEASPSPSSRSLTPSSRASSVSSDGSSFRRPSSSSSSSSTASSTLTTPVFSPTSLPENIPSPISISGIDFQNMDDLFSDSPNLVSPLDGLGLNFPSHTSFNASTILEKDIFQFGFETSTARLR